MGNDFTTLKERTDLADFIAGRTGGTIKKAGSDTMDISECPFCGGHDCFRVTPSKQVFHCYQCDKRGDVFDFIQFQDGCSHNEALVALAKTHGYELTGQPSTGPTRQPTVEEQAMLIRNAIFEAAAGYYHAVMLGDSRALGYQMKVRRHMVETLKAFRVGYSDGRLYEHMKGKGFTDDQLISSGLVKMKDGRPQDFFFHDLFIYPHLGPQGQVDGFSIKDQRKKYTFRLSGEYWGKGCMFYDMKAFAGKELFLVEGENDLLSVFGRGGFENVAATNGQISEEQLDYLADWAPGKTIYLCFDNDAGGQKHTEKVCNMLRKFCLPDIMAKMFKAEVVQLRLIRFDGECKDIDEYLKGQGDPKAALDTLIKGAERYFPPLRELKDLYSSWVRDPEEDRKFDYDTLGKICFEWFQARGKFFIDGEEGHLYFHNRIYRIGTNAPFKALLYDQAGINAATNGARLVFQNIESQAFLNGDHASVPGWIFTNFKESTVYFNLCGEHNTLLKIGPGKIEVVPNGTNAERVLLRNSPKMHPIRYMQDADVKKGMASLKMHLFDNLACNPADRYFVVCLLFNVVLLQYVKARGITKFSGTKGCGKTSAASMLSAIIYGEDCVTTGSAASDFSEAAVSPLTISDNLESEMVRGGKRDFLLTAATGITRQKRKAGSDSDNVYERSCTQLLVTSIEPFVEPELIERTNEIIFDKQFHNPDFKESVSVENDLQETRNLIWSTVFKIVAHDILPAIEQKKADALKILREDYPSHAKSRLNELYAMLFIILREVVKYISQSKGQPDPAEARWILNTWICDQKKRAYATELETNRILYGLEAILKEYEVRTDGFERGYGIHVKAVQDSHGEPSQLTFIASTRALFMAFDWLAKDRGIPNPFKTPSQLGARIGDSLEILNKAGWEFKRNESVLHGERRHHFVRKFEE
ncbi:MAG: toprim domain-containing protein [Desulfobulbaceae bacterium]|nr:MAG: toprim domain-containing protein [Desulfobulbaceae bacterium]